MRLRSIELMDLAILMVIIFGKFSGIHDVWLKCLYLPNPGFVARSRHNGFIYTLFWAYNNIQQISTRFLRYPSIYFR